MADTEQNHLSKPATADGDGSREVPTRLQTASAWDLLPNGSPPGPDGSDGSTQDGRAEDADALRRENAQLRQTLASRGPIEQAKGALMLRYGITADAAFAMLRCWSQGSNTKLRQVARELVDRITAGEFDTAEPGCADPAEAKRGGT